MNILVTNDDGIDAEGIRCLVQALEDAKIGSVTVVAPKHEQSAMGHAITMTRPLRVEKCYHDHHFFGYAVDGTPADCVKLAVRVLLPGEPDLVVSGINFGENAAVNVIYSGTVSAATEASILGIPSMALSLCESDDPSFKHAAMIGVRLVQQMKNKTLPEGTFLNVNIPPCPPDEIKGLRVTKQGRSRFIEEFDKRVDPRNREYYWLAGERISLEKDPGADDAGVLRAGYISVTPLHCDMTAYDAMEVVRGWGLEM